MSLTLKELGRLAGVHPSTVARVLNDDPHQRVSEEVRQRIITLAREYGYQPNHIARSLRTKRSYVIGTLIPDIANPFFAVVFRGIEDGLAERDYSVILANTDDSPEREARNISMLRGRQVDGLILATARRDDASIRALAEAGFPFMLVNRYTEPISPHAIVPDDYAGAMTAIEYLASLGHTRIAHIAGSDTVSTGHLRRQGYLDSVGRLGGPWDRKLLVEGNFRESGGYDAMQCLLRLEERPTAVFVVNDLAAAGALRAIQQTGLVVPRDISIIGFNDLSTAMQTTPNLTTLRVPLHDMGKAAVARLLDVLAGADLPDKPLILPVELVVRESTGPAPQ